ncbi:MAG TPA: hypothetical protein ENK73_02160, partial [Thiomicrospira sp.]|nr:hypothetical protein [Thiomicrospira sp.]
MSDTDAAAEAQKELEKALSSGVLLDDATTDALMAKINTGKNTDDSVKEAAPESNPSRPVDNASSTSPSEKKLEWWALGALGIISISSLVLNIIILSQNPNNLPLEAKTAKTIK